MNYYSFHIGDYLSATAHLSLMEHGAYRRMLDVYYVHEAPLPADKRQVYRLIGARSKDEKEAVDTVLDEYFKPSEDGWRHARCDFEIAKCSDGQEARDQRKANEAARVKRHREERAHLFDVLRSNGITAKWNDSIEKLREMVSNCVAVTLPVTAPVTPATASPSPHHPITPSHSEQPASTTSTGVARENPPEARARASPVALLSKALRAEGIDSQPADPRLQAMATQGVSPETLQAAAAEAKRAKPGERIPVGYVIGIVERWAKDAAAVSAGGAVKPIPRINGRQAAISNYAAQAAEARGESNGRATASERDITGEAVRVA